MHNIILANEKINYNPLVLGYSFFKVVKEKTNIQGYWKDSNGKLYIDNIQKINIGLIHKDYLQSLISQAFKEGEQAVFYKNIYNEAVILDNKGNEIILKNQILYIENVVSDSYINELSKNHEGFTIYELENNQFLIEIYK